MTNTSSANLAKRVLLAILIGSTVALSALRYFVVPEETNFEASATLGTEAKPVFGSANGYSIHCSGSRDAENCLAGQKSRGAKQAVLWLGNSQVHEVNQWQPGETNAAPMLFDSLGRHGLDLLTFSPPNASLQEHYVMFEHLRQLMPLKVLILPVVFDDMREEGIRADLADFAKEPATVRMLSQTAIGKRLIAAAHRGAKSELLSIVDDTAGMAGTMQERVEKSLNEWLNEHSQIWQLRPGIRGWIFIGLYRLRNFVFGINPSSTRKVIPGRYRSNLAALEAILDRSRRERIRVVMYVVPLRGGVKIPYDISEYASFKSEIETLARQYDVNFKNLEQLVPDDFWGTKASTSLSDEKELDFMHFRFPGHKLLAQALQELVLQSLTKSEVGSQP
jgi:hypothetical protein